MEILFVVITLGFILAMFVFARRLARNLTTPSDADVETANRLMTSGSKARATLTAIQPTGLTVNNFNVQVEIHFWMEPLDGSAEFEASKKLFCLETQFPRQGDIWPAWYDPADPTIFAVASPTKLSPEQIGMYREFGIEHPLDD